MLKNIILITNIINSNAKSQALINKVKRKLILMLEKFLSICFLILLPAIQRRIPKTKGINPAQIIGCQKSPPPIIPNPNPNAGKIEINKIIDEKIKPIGSPIRSAVREPILSIFVVVIFNVLN